MTISKSIFNLKNIYMDIKYACTNTNVKIWISKKTYHNVRILRKSDNVSPFINGIKKLLCENMTFVDYDDESITVKLPWLAWLCRNIIHKRIEFHVSTSLLFFISSRKPSNIIKLTIILSILTWKITNHNLIIHISINIWSSSSSSDKVSSHTA